MRSLLLPLFLGLLAAGVLGCDRPFVEPNPPDIEVLAPDPDLIATRETVDVVVRASSFRAVDRVELEGEPMTYDPADDTWRATRRVALGENALRLEAFDIENVSRLDTLFVVALPLRFTAINAPSFSEPRGGHTATLLASGHVLVTGGARSSDGSAQPDAFLIERSGGAIQRLQGRLLTPRLGHTATLLPDGRVLIIGGGRSDALIHEPGSLESLVEEVEIYDPEVDRFERVRVASSRPILRMGHTAMRFVLPDGRGGEEILIYLYGGSGDVGFGSPRWGLHDGLRAFQFRNDSLISIGPAFGTPFEPIAGHTLSPIDIDSATGLGRYLIAGTYFPPGAATLEDAETVAFQLVFSLDANLLDVEAPSFHTPRTRHAAAPILNGLVGFFGGRQPGLAGAISEAEVYASGANRMLRLPDALGLTRQRWGHTATILLDGRILLLGGFGTDGSALRFSEWVDLAPTADPP